MQSDSTKRCEADMAVLADAKTFLAHYGVDEFIYGITTKVLMPNSLEFKRLTRRLPSEMANANYCISSSELILKYRERYLKHFAKTDPTFAKRHAIGFSVWPDPKQDNPKGEQLENLMREYDIVSRATWLLPIHHHPEWYSVFILYSRQSREDFLENIKCNERNIELRLRLYTSFFNENYISELNPISNFNCLSERSLQVLTMTANGAFSEEIAEKLCITERGVIYHLDRMKELLNARNRAQLISMAHSLGLLNKSKAT